MEKTIDKQKMKLIIISASSLVLLISTVIIVACLNMGKSPGTGRIEEEDDDSGEVVGAFVEKTVATSSTTKPPQSTTAKPSGPAFELVFESNGDGSCTIASVGSFSGTSLIIPAKNSKGETVSGISDGAFENCDFIEAVTIPATVKSIGSGVFAGCTALCDITVNSANTRYCSLSGILFSKDKTELICYPANKADKNYLLSTNVKTISDFAFDGIKNLNAIYYEGSASKYNAINIGTGNQAFSALSVTCNYTPAK